MVRNLHRQDDQREQSYSERQLYEAALERLTREIAAVAGNDEVAAAQEIDEVLVSRAACLPVNASGPCPICPRSSGS